MWSGTIPSVTLLLQVLRVLPFQTWILRNDLQSLAQRGFRAQLIQVDHRNEENMNG